MKKIIIPKSQKDIIVRALNKLSLDLNPNEDHVRFDLIGLTGFMKGNYEVSVEMTEKQQISFGFDYGVDCPEYILDKKEEVIIPNFDYIFEINDDDNTLSFDVRGNVEFANSEVDDDSFILFNVIQEGESKIIDETPYIIASTETGWVVLENGVIVEDIDLYHYLNNR